MIRLIDCKEGNSSLSLMCRVLWELKSLGASTCLQMGHTWQSSSAAVLAAVVGVCQAFFLFLFFFPPPVPDCFSNALQSPWAVRSSCCLLVSGKSTSSSLKMRLKLSPSRSLQLWWYWAADITLWEQRGSHQAINTELYYNIIFLSPHQLHIGKLLVLESLVNTESICCYNNLCMFQKVHNQE